MNILLVTPPLTQLNTPYPATAYLKSFLQKKGYKVYQCDLGIELINRLFTRDFLIELFGKASFLISSQTPVHITHIFNQKDRYADTIDAVMRFLRNEDNTLATRICNGHFLPEASRFKNMADPDWAFGALGFTDRARYLATLYIEDLTDFIHETVDPYFELGRYAEHLSIYAPEFDAIKQAVEIETNIIDTLMLEILKGKLSMVSPALVGFSIPFPGNLYGAVKCGQFLKMNYPSVSVAWGGGFINTELRNLSDAGVFDYTDYILFDDGELPMLRLMDVLGGERQPEELIRTKLRENDAVLSVGWNEKSEISFTETGVPDYSDLPLHNYISLIETANPMHKLWSDGRWNKLTLAHGCYWRKCAFCDTSLSYIANYESIPATLLADRMEAIVQQTGTTGFHFVDEAASPKVLRELSEEILKRKLSVSWWTNIRFEKAFTNELCALMSSAGCIAVSGGIEVASNRLLKLMNKGVTVEQAASTAFYLTQNDIMVHAYLMYGFPSQTVPETINALEMVRQMFDEGILQSAFWHRYAMTIHSPSGMNPEHYGAKLIPCPQGTFANNEIPFTDGQEIDLDMMGEGLRKATFNYMHGLCLDWIVNRWFSEKVPKPAIGKSYIKDEIHKHKHA